MKELIQKSLSLLLISLMIFTCIVPAVPSSAAELKASRNSLNDCNYLIKCNSTQLLAKSYCYDTEVEFVKQSSDGSYAMIVETQNGIEYLPVGSLEIDILNERDLAVFNDTSLEGLLTEYSISQQEYESNISPTEGYITFRDFDLLNSKGCQVKDVPESYQRIFGLIKEKFGIVKPADIKEPITLQNGRYSLVAVRDNKSRIDNNKRSQKMWYLFVKLSNDPIE